MNHVSTILYYITRNNKDIFLSEKKIESTNPPKNRKKKSISTYVNLLDDTTLRNGLHHSIPESDSSLPICRGPTYVHQRYKTHF